MRLVDSFVSTRWPETEAHIAVASAAVFFAYVVACLTLYGAVPAFTSFVDDLDYVPEALEGYLRVLAYYETYLAEYGKPEWITLTRHVYAVSLVFIAVPVAWHLLTLRRRLSAYIEHAVAKAGTTSSWLSFNRYVLTTLGIVGAIVLAFHVLYVWELTLTGRSGRGLIRNDYLRLLVLMPWMACFFGGLVPIAIDLLVGLFSRRLYEALER